MGKIPRGGYKPGASDGNIRRSFVICHQVFPILGLVKNLKITKIGNLTGNSWQRFEFPVEGVDAVHS
jgi:hypothetical protein